MGSLRKKTLKRRSASERQSAVVIAAFSEEQVGRLTNISKSQLRYWDRTEFFSPSYGDDDRRQAYSRLYSFRDLVCLSVLNSLRNDSRVSLSHLREVKECLSHLGDDVWTKTTLYVLNRRVIFDNPTTKAREDVVNHQGVLQIPLLVVKGRMEEAVKHLWTRSTEKVGSIERLRNVAHNQPVIAGTRIPIRAVKNFHEAGYTVKQIIAEYPDLTERDVQAALAYKGDKAAA
jgi:uncharacterized protein (DUF433 family)